MNKLVLSLALGLLACGGAKPNSVVPAHDLAGVLISTEQLQTPPFMVQQHIKGAYQNGEVEMDCVVQLKDKKLTVVGMSPFGRTFSIEQQGTEVKFQKYIDREIPVQPEMVLYDIHRVFFRALPEGESQGQDNSDMVSELRAGDYVLERRFQNMEGPSNLVVVTFDGPPAPVVAPHVTITNTAFGYTLEIENSQQQLLDQSYTLEVQNGEAPAEPPPSELPQSADPRVKALPSAD